MSTQSHSEFTLPRPRVILLLIVVLMAVSGVAGGLLDGQTADTIQPQPAASH